MDHKNMKGERPIIDKELLGKYLAGENCTQQELDILKEYLTNDTYSETIRQLMEAEWTYLNSIQVSNAQADENYQRFVTSRLEPYKRKQQKVVRLFRESMKYAAITLFLVAGITAIYHFKGNKAQLAASVQWIEKQAGRGQRHKLTMPDSTVIYLAPDSRIWYPSPEQYASGNRTVRLEGEAYFEVVHNDEHPFTVQTGLLQTVDVGTAFNIRAYPYEKDIEVAVAEGEVEVMKADPSQRSVLKNLRASQGIVFNNELLQWKETIANAAEIGNWRKGIFGFSSETLENITAVMARHYNLHFEWQDDALKKKKITILFNGDSRATALQILALTAGVKLQETNNTIRVSKK